jgi:hypothetical protein
MTDYFPLHREHLFAHLWTFYTIVLQFLHTLHFGCKLPRINTMDFSSTHAFNMKKVDNCVNSTAGRIISCRRHNSLCRDKNKHYMTSYVMVYKAMNHVMLPHMHEPPPPVLH